MDRTMRNLEQMLIRCSEKPANDPRSLKSSDRRNCLQCNGLLMKRNREFTLRLRPKIVICFSCLVVAVVICYHLTVLSPIAVRNYLLLSSEWDEQLDQCVPRNSVVFLKTHKTAGSTIQNILLRYADSHELLVALPYVHNYLGHPEHFDRKFVPPLKPNYSYNILCHHARFNFQEMKHVINDNATFMTILRDPVHLFESLFSYYKLNKFFNLNLEDFAFGTRVAIQISKNRYYRRIGRNQMLFDLGMSDIHFDDTDSVWMYVQYLDRRFDLVMIAERMMESLVLLRHLLCWEVEDVLMFKHNVRLPFNKVSLEPEIEDGLRELNRADQILYDYFDQRLSEQIAKFGVKRMKYEVEELEKKLKFWHDFCVQDEVESKNLSRNFKPLSNQVYGFKLRENATDTVCENLAKAELPFTDEIRKKQKPYYSIDLKQPNWKSRKQLEIS